MTEAEMEFIRNIAQALGGDINRIAQEVRNLRDELRGINEMLAEVSQTLQEGE
jgi:hypothetical protein